MKATFATISAMANWKTRIVHFLLLPIINMLLLTIINQQFFTNLSWNIASASVLMSGAIMAISSLVTSFTMDRMLGIDREMMAKSSFLFYYWCTKLIASALMAFIVIFINLFLLWIISFGEIQFMHTILLSPVIIFSALIVGSVAAIGAWGFRNPYFISNFIETFGSILGGVIISITYYPVALKFVCGIFPFSHTISLVHDVNSNLWNDIFIDVAWLILAILLYQYQTKRILHKSKFSTL